MGSIGDEVVADNALINDRGEARALAEELFESAPDATVVVDEQGLIVRANAETEELFGYQRCELIGQPIEILMPGGARAGHVGLQSRLNTDPRTRLMGSGLELWGRRKDGSEFPAEVSLKPLRADSGVLILSAIRDVSERKRLEGLAAHLAAVVRSSADAIVGKTVEGVIVSWNPGAERLYGYSAAEAIGQSIAFLLPDGHDDELATLLKRAASGECVRGFETVRQRKDGVIVDVSLTLSPILDPAGRVIGVSTVARDITEQKRAAAALADAQADLHRFFELSPDLMAIADAGRFTRVNRAWESVLGYTSDEIVGRPFADFIHPDDLEATVAHLAKRQAGDAPLGGYENRYRCKDGSYRWIVWNATPLEGGLRVGMGRDVTEQRKAEEALRAAERLVSLAFDHSPQGIVLRGPDARVIRVNQAYADMLGYTREEISEGLDPGRYKHPEDAGVDAPIFAAVHAGETDVAHYERRYIHADGRTVWVHVSLSAIRDASGAVELLVGQFEDITEGKRLEQELHEANARALADSEGRYREILETTPDGVWRLDAEGRTDYVNPRMAAMLGYSVEEMLEDDLSTFAEPEWLEVQREAIDDARREQRPGVREARFLRKDGSTCLARVSYMALSDQDGNCTGGLAIMSDITASKANELELRASEHFMAAVTDSIAEGLFAFDRDGQLKFANRAAERLLGWTADELAVRFARARSGALESSPPRQEPYVRLMSPLSTGTPARTEDDTFILKDGRELPVAYSSSPIMIDGQIEGLVVVFIDITERKAQEACQRKELETLSWVGRIREALDEDRLVLYAQPIIDVRSRKVVKHELLLRMVGRDGQIIAPGQFLPTAEQYGQIEEIDLWVMEQAVKFAAKGMKVNFNISGKSLGSRGLIAKLAQALRETGADPALLICEITETSVAVDEIAATAYVNELSVLGCGISLDDFGMGYGGLTSLKRMPLTELKIDSVFAHDLVQNPRNQHVVKAVVNLARGFGQKTVAEGIEDLHTLTLMEEYGVDYAQGFAIGRPAPMDTLPAAPPRPTRMLGRANLGEPPRGALQHPRTKTR
jgi:PAS domain S-box-containing protein